MSLPSAACVKFQSWVEFLAVNIRCFIVNVLSLTILRCFYFNLVGCMQVYWKAWGYKEPEVVIFWMHPILDTRISRLRSDFVRNAQTNPPGF